MKVALLLLSGLLASSCMCGAQQSSPAFPASPAASADQMRRSLYTAPTQSQRFKAYLHAAYGLGAILEAGARGGIDQARNQPSQWPQGGEGYADRFGSAMGEIAVRETTDYLIADIFKEDIRRIHCQRPCGESRFKLAFEDSFLARKGTDGHEAFSIARILGPISGNAVAVNTWYPSGTVRIETAKGAGLTYGLIFTRNLLREFMTH